MRSHLVTVEDEVKLTHVAKMLIEDLHQHLFERHPKQLRTPASIKADECSGHRRGGRGGLNQVEDAQLTLIAVNYKAEKQRGILSVDNTCARHTKPGRSIDEAACCFGTRIDGIEELFHDQLLLLHWLRSTQNESTVNRIDVGGGDGDGGGGEGGGGEGDGGGGERDGGGGDGGGGDGDGGGGVGAGAIVTDNKQQTIWLRPRGVTDSYRYR